MSEEVGRLRFSRRRAERDIARGSRPRMVLVVERDRPARRRQLLRARRRRIGLCPINHGRCLYPEPVVFEPVRAGHFVFEPVLTELPM